MVNNLEYLGYSQPMALAIAEALKVNPYPNPRVGAVLTDKTGNIKAISNHVRKGNNHAEMNIFEQVEAQDSDTLYITLEPCFHSDSSPSCAKAIIEQGIKKVVIGDIDLDQRTNGKSISLLKDNNISVEIEPNANNLLNPYYENIHAELRDIHYLLKVGMSENGYITNNSTDSKYITNEVSLKIVHYLRATADCILIGKNTLLNDKPKLDVRLDNFENVDVNPFPIVLWGSSTTLLNEAMNQYPHFTFLSSQPSHDNNVNCFTNSLNEVEEYFKDRKFRNIFIEGGREIINSYLNEDKIDSIYEFKSLHSIQDGMHIGNAYNQHLNNGFKIRSKYELMDNFLTTYTKN